MKKKQTKKTKPKNESYYGWEYKFFPAKPPKKDLWLYFSCGCAVGVALTIAAYFAGLLLGRL